MSGNVGDEEEAEKSSEGEEISFGRLQTGSGATRQTENSIRRSFE